MLVDGDSLPLFNSCSAKVIKPESLINSKPLPSCATNSVIAVVTIPLTRFGATVKFFVVDS